VATRFRQSLATHLGRQSDDVWGLVLITLGLVSALGIYADLTGPAGRAWREATADAFGVGRLLVPVALCAIGGVLVRLIDRGFVPHAKVIRDALGVPPDMSPSLFYELYDPAPPIDIDNPTVVEPLRARMQRALS